MHFINYLLVYECNRVSVRVNFRWSGNILRRHSTRKCTVWSQCTTVPDGQTDRRTNVMEIARPRRYTTNNQLLLKHSLESIRQSGLRTSILTRYRHHSMGNHLKREYTGISQPQGVAKTEKQTKLSPVCCSLGLNDRQERYQACRNLVLVQLTSKIF